MNSYGHEIHGGLWSCGLLHFFRGVEGPQPYGAGKDCNGGGGCASETNLPIEWVPYRNKHGDIRKRKAHLPYAQAYQKGVVQSKRHNQAAIRAALWLADHGRPTLIICRNVVEHFETLKKMLEAEGIPFLAVKGNTDTTDRHLAKRALADRTVQVVLCSEIWGEGEDLPSIKGMVLADGVKSVVTTVQRIGRGLEKEVGGESDLWVVDIVPTGHPTLLKHGLARCEAYEAEGYEIRVVDKWPKLDESDDNLLPFKRW